MNEIDALLGLGMEGPDQTQALADSLRGRKRAADVFSLSTVGNIAKGAQREQDSIMEGAQRGGVLRQAMAEKAAKKEEADADRLSRENIAKWQNEAAAAESKLRFGSGIGGGGKLTSIKRRIDPETNQPVDIGQDRFGQWHVSGSEDIIDPTLYDESLTASQMANQMGDLESMIEGPRNLISALEEYDTAYQPYTEGGDTPTEYGEIPGSGRFSGKTDTLGQIGRRFEELGGQGEQPDKLFAVANAITNTKVREGAGLSQTITEIENMKNELASGFLATPGAKQEAIARIKRAMKTELEQKWSAIHPQVRDQYLRQLEALEMANPFEAELAELQFPTETAEKSTKQIKLEANNKRLAELKAKEAT